MLLGSNALASAPLMASAERAYNGVPVPGKLRLSASAVQVVAALYSGAAAARQHRPVLGRPAAQPTRSAIQLSENRTIVI